MLFSAVILTECTQWIISDAIDTWNEVVPKYESIDAKTFTNDYAKPVVAGLNHLINGGGLGDFQSAPGDVRLLPRSHNMTFLRNLRDGFRAL